MSVRLFVGIPLAPDVEARTLAFVDALRPLAELRWSRDQQLHLTLKFIGETTLERVAAIEAVLRTLARRAPLHLEVRGVGWFPNTRAPRVFWAGVDGGIGIAKLADDMDAALCGLGIPKETRAYTAHVTLARVPPGARIEDLRKHLERRGAPDLGGFTADHFTLYESRQGVHHALAKFPLNSERGAEP